MQKVYAINFKIEKTIDLYKETKFTHIYVKL